MVCMLAEVEAIYADLRGLVPLKYERISSFPSAHGKVDKNNIYLSIQLVCTHCWVSGLLLHVNPSGPLPGSSKAAQHLLSYYKLQHL